ncbi:MAG: helix-turn-helix transcriptional regulator, partial [Microvirga sp.]
MVQPFARAAVLDTQLTLTVREQEIIRHIAQGAQNDGIAHQMGISANTVKTHIGNIMRKFGLH